MKKLAKIAFIIVVLYFVLLKLFLNLINYESDYDVEDVNALLTEIEEKHYFVNDIEAVEKRGGIIVRIEYVGHQEININNSLKQDIKEGFSRTDIMKSMLSDTDDKVYLTVEFVDIVNMVSSEMSTEIYYKNETPKIDPWFK